MNRLKSLRFEKGLTLREVAESAGISHRTLVRLEQGSQPTAPIAKALADFYGLTVSELLGLDEPKAAA